MAHVIPAGITWEQVRRNEHRVTIRREPEFVYDLADFRNAAMAQTADMQNAISTQNGKYSAGLSSVFGDLFG